MTFRNSSAAVGWGRSTGAKAALANLIAGREGAKQGFDERAHPGFSEPGQRVSAVAGLAIAVLFPALFWTSLVAGASALLGASVSPASLLTIGGVIAGFLTLVCGPLVLRSEMPRAVGAHRTCFRAGQAIESRGVLVVTCFGDTRHGR